MAIKDKTLSKALDDFQNELTAKESELEILTVEWSEHEKEMALYHEREMELMKYIDGIRKYIIYISEIIGVEPITK